MSTIEGAIDLQSSDWFADTGHHQPFWPCVFRYLGRRRPLSLHTWDQEPQFMRMDCPDSYNRPIESFGTSADMVPKFFLSSVRFLSEWCFKAASNALQVSWYVLSSCALRKSYFMRINIGSKSVLEAKRNLSGFRLWFNYASFTWKLFCKHSKRLHHF